MKIIFMTIFLVSCLMLSAIEYKIDLLWDEFEGECNGFISGTIGSEFGFVNGAGSQETLEGKLISIGEGRTMEAKQSFIINSEDGYFTFWIKDKFTDDDLAQDPTLIARSKPVIKIYKGRNLVRQIKVPSQEGLTCKVFDLDVSTDEINEELKFYPKSRLIVGKVVNAVDGEALSDVNISITDYMRESRIFTTDEKGIFLFDVEIGEYTLGFSKEGFIGTTIYARMGADETPREVICAMSPEIKEFRIILTWGSIPKDLDAHLSGPDPDGGNFHIWYRNKILIAGKNFLDRDDTKRYGPETITIYKPAIGEYYYSVYDYTNRTKKKSKSLSRSNAVVQIYGMNKLLASFEVPEDIKGNCWHVFKINEIHEIIPINNIDVVLDERSIQ